ncbi:hypothetical protein FDECE_9440 [Fusarium decemcellulare]|nr:hypothetical protein FDECE_9440 [Fusarium decemcellulare]
MAIARRSPIKWAFFQLLAHHGFVAVIGRMGPENLVLSIQEIAMLLLKVEKHEHTSPLFFRFAPLRTKVKKLKDQRKVLTGWESISFGPLSSEVYIFMRDDGVMRLVYLDF